MLRAAAVFSLIALAACQSEEEARAMEDAPPSNVLPTQAVDPATAMNQGATPTPNENTPPVTDGIGSAVPDMGLSAPAEPAAPGEGDPGFGAAGANEMGEGADGEKK